MTETEFRGTEIKKCGNLLPSQGGFNSYYPKGTWTYSDLGDVKAQNQYLYAYVIFIYRENDRSPVIVQTKCIYFFGDLNTMHQCSGDTNRAWYHVESD